MGLLRYATINTTYCFLLDSFLERATGRRLDMPPAGALARRYAFLWLSAAMLRLMLCISYTPLRAMPPPRHSFIGLGAATLIIEHVYIEDANVERR